MIIYNLFNMETNNRQESREYIKAKKRVEAIKAFYIHTLVVSLLIPFLIFINFKTYWEYHWFWWPVVGNVLGLIIHGAVVMSNNTDWEERKIREFMDQDNFND
ncbi:MAG: histidine kinase [Flavobacteriaceae bacterium]|nr:MAG: histidine kinase [Flavobacteriaceae bacterium]